MPEQELDSPKIASSSVNQHRLRPTQGVGAELRWVETDASDPLLDEASVLTGGQAALAIIFAAGIQKLAKLSPGHS